MKKWKKHLEISFYTSITKIMIRGYTVSKIWSVTNVIGIFHFGLFFALLHITPSPPPNSPKNENIKKQIKKNTWKYHHLTQLYQKSRSYVLLSLRYGTWWMQLLFFILGLFFFPVSPITAQKIKISKTWKNSLKGDIIVLHRCTKNYD